jgi:cyclic pyranopterin phosphate synthase
MISDSTGRTFKKLRVSLTHECNYACIYCSDKNRPDTSYTRPTLDLPAKKVLSPSELTGIIRKLHQELNLNSVRLTGGEPLLYPGITTIVAAIRDMGISSIGITTNGHLLSVRAKDLYDSGLISVNISLDAITPESFKLMSLRNGLSVVLNAIDASMDAGLNVKLNTVVVAGKNDDQILPLLEFAHKKGIIIRFLELMPMGPLHASRKELFYSSSQILGKISQAHTIEMLPRDENATADYWSINGKKAFGIIANDSTPFCSDCNRLRLDSFGNLYGCLSNLIPIPVSPDTGSEELKSSLKLAITHKQSSHFTGNSRTMQSIGG